MYLSDYTITEAEMIYQKAVIRGAWLFLAFLVACVLVAFIIWLCEEHRKETNRHAEAELAIMASNDIGQTGFHVMSANQGQIIRRLTKEIERKDKHIEMLENTMEKVNLGDLARKIKEEVEEDGKD